MDFSTFRRVTKILRPEISVIMRGRHGIGKSEVVRQISEEDFGLPIIERRLSQLTEGDLIGLPFKVDNKVTKFLPPDWFHEAMEKPYMLFLDEFDRSIHEVQQAAMELILDRSIQGNKIHPECRVFAAINGGKNAAMYNVTNIDLALNDRFWIADMDPSVDEWLSWARKDNNVIPEIIDFILKFNDHLEHKEMPQEAHEITPSRRSWKRLSDTLKDNPILIEEIEKNLNSQNKKEILDTFIQLCIGFVGIDATASFKDHIINSAKNISVEDVMSNFDKNKTKIENASLEQKNYIIEKIFQHSTDELKSKWTKDEINNIFKFFNTLPSESKISMWDRLTMPECKMDNSRPFAELVAPTMMDLV